MRREGTFGGAAATADKFAGGWIQGRGGEFSIQLTVRNSRRLPAPSWELIKSSPKLTILCTDLTGSLLQSSGVSRQLTAQSPCAK